MKNQLSGVYKISCSTNGRYYIGSAVKLKTRQCRHFCDLKHKRHHNLHLQRMYDKYGHDSFEFNVIEYCDKNKTVQLEQQYLNKFIGDKLCVNMGKTATFGDTLSKHPNKKEIIRKRTESFNKLMAGMSQEERNKMYGKYGKDNWSTGGNFKESTRKKLRKCGRIGAKIRAEQMSGKSFEEVYGTNKATEIKKKLSDSLVGKMSGHDNPFFGKRHTEKHKEEQRQRMTGRYGYNKSKPIVIDNIDYISLKHASDLLNIPVVTILYRLKSKNFGNYQYK